MSVFIVHTSFCPNTFISSFVTLITCFDLVYFSNHYFIIVVASFRSRYLSLYFHFSHIFWFPFFPLDNEFTCIFFSVSVPFFLYSLFSFSLPLPPSLPPSLPLLIFHFWKNYNCVKTTNPLIFHFAPRNEISLFSSFLRVPSVPPNTYLLSFVLPVCEKGQELK